MPKNASISNKLLIKSNKTTKCTNVNLSFKLPNKKINNTLMFNKFKLPKKKKFKFNNNDNNNNNSNIKIKLNKRMKPKTNTRAMTSRRLPQWTLRLTKFDHYISSKELMAASVQEKTSKIYRNYGVAFYEYIESVRKIQDDLPRIGDILNNFDIFQLDVLIYEYLTTKFNAKAVTGGTLRNTACGILWSLAVDFGISLTCELLPGVRKVCKGADNTLRDIFGDHPRGKYPILNPILEKMLDHATAKEKFALLIAQRFCLRSQHYCNNRNENVRRKNNYILIEDFSFIPNMEDPRAISIATSHDKNNPNLEHMERVIHCCCGTTKWTCVVHFAKQYFEEHKYEPGSALVQCKTGDMHYRAMLKIVKNLIKKIGLNPDNYGTHSCRSGGTTEWFLVGKQAIWIQNFGWWNNIGSVMIYVRPNNPDLATIFGSTLEYSELRASEGQALDKRENDLTKLQLEVNKQNKKRIKGNKVGKILKQAAVVSGHAGGNITTMNIAVKRTERKQSVYTQYGPHTYNAVNGRWVHNPAAKAYMVASPLRDVRTVKTQVNAQVRWTGVVHVPSPSKNINSKFKWTYPSGDRQFSSGPSKLDNIDNFTNYSNINNNNNKHLVNPYKAPKGPKQSKMEIEYQ